jgi:hypothetical protein
MALTASDQALLGQIEASLQTAQNIPWSSLLGQTTLATPAAGQPTLGFEQLFGSYSPSVPGSYGQVTQPSPMSTTEQELLGLGNVPLAASDVGQGINSAIVQFAQANNVSSDMVQGYVAAYGRLPGSLADIGSYVQRVGPGGPGAPGQKPGTMSAQRVTATQPWLNLTQPFQGINFNGIPLAPGSVVPTQLPTLAAQQAYGNVQGATNNPYTLAAQEAAGYIGGTGLGESGGGTETLAKQTLNADSGLNVLKLLSTLGGPSDAFKQQAVLHGLDSTGLSNAVGAIQGKYGLPTFSAPRAQPQAQSLGSLMNSVGSGGWTGAGANYSALDNGGSQNSGVPGGGGTLAATQGADGSYSVNPPDGGTTVYGGTHIHMNSAGGASSMDPTTAAYVNSLPAPNKINGPNFERLDDNSKKFILSAYSAAGYDPADVLGQVGAGLPQFSAPKAGLVSASGALAG